MRDKLETIVFLVALFIGLPVFILWVRDRVSNARWQRRHPSEKLAADRAAYEQRILSPDWTFYERHLQRPAPAALRELYADSALVTAQGLDYEDFEYITTFEALDPQALLDTRQQLGFDAVAIATGQFGDPIYLKPGVSEGDALYITHHDGGDTEVFAESVAAMVERLRQTNPTGSRIDRI
ncbi:MAG: hypothetical protein M3Z54_08020 [Gemmatimonadota bacterium]|nr:hypothetical protein [Gemmatimonadota bacterium]